MAKRRFEKDELNSANYISNVRLYSMSDRTFLALVNLMVGVFGMIVLYPLIYIVSMSFSSVTAIMEGRVWLLPVNFTLVGYEAVFKNTFIVSGYGNSLFYMVFATVLNVLMTMICAYPLTRKFLLRNAFMFLLTFTMFFSGGLIPTYMLISRLGLINTRLVMILPGALSAWNVIVTQTFIKTTISDELREAADLDGCGDIRYLCHIVFPLSKAIIAVVALWTAVGSWNAYFNALLYLPNKSMWPLQMILREILILNQMTGNMTSTAVNAAEMSRRIALRELLKYSLIIVASVPLLIMYPFVQKYFVKGVMLGSVKG
jgi:ABC-type glycerol-3-phosphate transport system permease component